MNESFRSASLKPKINPRPTKNDQDDHGRQRPSVNEVFVMQDDSKSDLIVGEGTDP